VQRTGRSLIRDLAYGVRDAAAHRGAVEIILRRKLIGAALSSRASSPYRFSIRLGAHQMVDLG
jgi:hypothetical protein